MTVCVEHDCEQCNSVLTMFFRAGGEYPYQVYMPVRCHQRYECRSMAECATVKVEMKKSTPFEILDLAIQEACRGDAGTKVSLTLLEAKAIQHALMGAGIK